MDDNNIHKTLLQIAQHQQEQDKKLNRLIDKIPADNSGGWLLAVILAFALGAAFMKCNKETYSPFQIAPTFPTETK